MSPIALAAVTSLTPENIALIRQQIGGAPDSWLIDEIGDGNVNMIFRLDTP